MQIIRTTVNNFFPNRDAGWVLRRYLSEDCVWSWVKDYSNFRNYQWFEDIVTIIDLIFKMCYNNAVCFSLPLPIRSILMLWIKSLRVLLSENYFSIKDFAKLKRLFRARIHKWDVIVETGVSLAAVPFHLTSFHLTQRSLWSAAHTTLLPMDSGTLQCQAMPTCRACTTLHTNSAK